MESGDRILVAAGLTAAVVVGAFVLWGPGGAPRVRKRRGQIAGLQNLGRTCFLNTLLQALAACPAFVAWLRRHSRPTAHNSMITTLYTVIEVVNGTHESARGTPVCPLGVLQALRAAGWVVPTEQQDAHELLHVLLTCITEETQAMAKKPGCLSDALGLSPAPWTAGASPASPPHPRADSTPPTPGARPPRPASVAPTSAAEPDLVDPEPWEPLAAPPFGSGGLSKGLSRSFCQLSGSRRWLPPSAPRSPLPPPFRGSLASRLQCTVCNTKSPIRYDKFDSLTLSMPPAVSVLTSSCSLQGLLRAFTAPELVKEVRCGRCAPAATGGDGEGQAQGAPLTHHIRTVSIGKLPQVLCLHIGRVEWSDGALSKRSEHVAFPEQLSLAPYVAAGTSASATQNEIGLMSVLGGVRLASLQNAGGAGGGHGQGGEAGGCGAAYRLTGVVVHVGGPKSGHFATYRRGNGFEANRWWYTSDTLVHEVSLTEVLRCVAYLMFYERTTSAHTSRPLPAIDTGNDY